MQQKNNYSLSELNASLIENGALLLKEVQKYTTLDKWFQERFVKPAINWGCPKYVFLLFLNYVVFIYYHNSLAAYFFLLFNITCLTHDIKKVFSQFTISCLVLQTYQSYLNGINAGKSISQ